MIVGLAEDVITGFAFTFIAKVLVDEHPAAFVPVTVYIVVAVGVITILAPVNAPGFQRYVEPPIAVKVAFVPEQTKTGLEVAVIVGDALTNNVIVFVVEQDPVAPVTV
jgi:hypothetical protein